MDLKTDVDQIRSEFCISITLNSIKQNENIEY